MLDGRYDSAQVSTQPCEAEEDCPAYNSCAMYSAFLASNSKLHPHQEVRKTARRRTRQEDWALARWWSAAWAWGTVTSINRWHETCVSLSRNDVCRARDVPPRCRWRFRADASFPFPLTADVRQETITFHSPPSTTTPDVWSPFDLLASPQNHN